MNTTTGPGRAAYDVARRELNAHARPAPSSLAETMHRLAEAIDMDDLSAMSIYIADRPNGREVTVTTYGDEQLAAWTKALSAHDQVLGDVTQSRVGEAFPGTWHCSRPGVIDGIPLTLAWIIHDEPQQAAS